MKGLPLAFSFLAFLTLSNLRFSRANAAEESEDYLMKNELIYKSRNIYDKVSIDLNQQVLSIISGKFNNHTVKDVSTVKSKSIIYNRVNKCGSTSLMRLVEDLGFQNGYLLVSHGLPKIRTLHEEQKSSFANLLCDPTAPRMVMSRHIDFVDWSRYGCDIMYFNQVK